LLRGASIIHLPDRRRKEWRSIPAMAHEILNRQSCGNHFNPEREKEAEKEET